MKPILSLLIIALLVSACTPYPRYRTDAPAVRQQAVSESPRFTTGQFIRFGLIIQEKLGKPYRGRSKYLDGLDCSEFVAEVFREYNKTQLPRTAADQFKTGKNISARMLRLGDLVFFRTTGSGISHVGIYTDNNRFIHASSSRGVIISSLGEDYWAKRFVGARRILDLDPN